ncbi:hypothetical protein [Pedobacter sp. MC2016-24]|uniref:hypothetical protein n=1 Tax=Pedobacter sp. MC2016-24 TaxID=2780090 RepID=UPI00187FFFEF|nr:hypothetical protein [Pedobacter sp. MC2016-24]MBE9599853.1 hypothetical protein [Pedobacter sp. MC2016-24]
MNFLILGTEIPDNRLPYTSFQGPASAKEDQNISKIIKVLQSDSYSHDLEKLRLHYKEKLGQLQTLCRLILGKYAVFNSPDGGLGAWIKLNQDQNIYEVLPLLAEIEIYNVNDNPQLNPKLPIIGIRAGFGTPDITIYEKAFHILAKKFKTNQH